MPAVVPAAASSGAPALLGYRDLSFWRICPLPLASPSGAVHGVFQDSRVLCTRGLQKNHSVAQWSSKESWGALDTTRVWVSDANDAAGRRGSHIGGRQHTHGVVKKHAWCVATGRGGFRSGNGKSRHNRSVASTEGARTHTRGLEGHCQRGACIEHAGRDVLHLGETRSAEGRKRGKRKGGRDLHDVQSRSRRGCGRCEGWGAAV